MNDDKIISVSDLTREIKILLEEDFDDISLEGEISNYKAHSSGHKYFTLKDSGAAIGAVMWRYRPRLSFEPEDGMKVIAKGSITLYPPQGRYQIDVEEMIPVGQGNLYIAFEALKKKLSEKGYFDQERKQALPRFPQKIGVATSPTGAAVRDIFSTIERRYKAAEIYFRPTLVQGPGAAEDIVKAIEELNKSDVEVIIIGRGGGSLEDLWCFNEEITADAIMTSEKPIVSAVGHETDFTISDFTADYRAATPTAAAEIVTNYTSEYLLDYLDNSRDTLFSDTMRKIELMKEDLDDNLQERSYRRLMEKINYLSQRLDDSESTNQRIINNRLNHLKIKIDGLSNNIYALDPQAPLRKGYALLKVKGKPISVKQSLTKFKDIEIVRSDETIIAKILGHKQGSIF